MTTQAPILKTIPFDVRIPNLDGDGIADTIRIEVQCHADPETGEDVLTPESMDLIEKTQARHMGLMSAAEIKALRLRLCLSQDEMSQLLQIGGKSYTRWESGRARPSRSINLMLCALRDGQLDVNYLRAQQKPAVGSAWLERHPSGNRFVSAPNQPVPTQVVFVPWRPRPGEDRPHQSLLLWGHVFVENEETALCSTYGKSGLMQALLRAFESQAPVGVAATLLAPPLPSEREQRAAFLHSRTDSDPFEEPISG